MRPPGGCLGRGDDLGAPLNEKQESLGQQRWIRTLSGADLTLLLSRYGCIVVKHSASFTGNTAKKGAS